MKVGLPSALSNGFFAMDPARAEFYIPIAISILDGTFKGNEILSSEAPSYPSFHIPESSKSLSAMAYNADMNSYEYEGFGNAPQDSIAIIPIHDAIMKADYCGSMGTKSLTRIVNDADSSDNISAIILDLDTPGGEVFGTKELSDAIGKTKKPVIAYISEGICASAGYYIACQADRILMHQPTDMIGSIGVYTTIIDPRGAYEKDGIKVHTVYSPKSASKNAEWRAIFDQDPADTSLLEERLTFLDETFMNQVREGRGDKLNEEALEGGMFFTDQAIRLGLADGQASFDEVIEIAITLSRKSITI
jgi:protease-4